MRSLRTAGSVLLLLCSVHHQLSWAKPNYADYPTDSPPEVYPTFPQIDTDATDATDPRFETDPTDPTEPTDPTKPYPYTIESDPTDPPTLDPFTNRPNPNNEQDSERWYRAQVLNELDGNFDLECQWPAAASADWYKPQSGAPAHLDTLYDVRYFSESCGNDVHIQVSHLEEPVAPPNTPPPSTSTTEHIRHGAITVDVDVKELNDVLQQVDGSLDEEDEQNNNPNKPNNNNNSPNPDETTTPLSDDYIVPEDDIGAR